MSRFDFNPPECASPLWGPFTSAMVRCGFWPDPVLMTQQNRPEWEQHWNLFAAGAAAQEEYLDDYRPDRPGGEE